MFERIADGVYIQPSLLFQTVTVIVEDHDSVTVVDPNYFPHEILVARDAYTHLQSKRVRHGRLALTHSDFDHIVGVPYFEDLDLLVHDSWDAQNALRAQGKVVEFDAGFYIERNRSFSGPIEPDVRVASDGEAVGSFLGFHAQGHTRDGLVLYHRPSRALIVGDYLSDLEFPFIYTSAFAYRDTLARLKDLIDRLDVSVLISQHGPPARTAAAMADRIRETEAYLDAVFAAASDESTKGVHASAEAVAATTLAAWRSGIPTGMRHYHDENAKITLKEIQLRL